MNSTLALMPIITGSAERLAEGFETGEVTLLGRGVDLVALQEALADGDIAQKPLEQSVILFNAAVAMGDVLTSGKLGRSIAKEIQSDPDAIETVLAKVRTVAFQKLPTFCVSREQALARARALLSTEHQPEVSYPNRYELVGVIHHAAERSIIHWALDKLARDMVAIKVFRGLGNDEEHRRGLRREINFLLRIGSHPNIVKILDAGEDFALATTGTESPFVYRQPFLVMEDIGRIPLNVFRFNHLTLSWNEAKKIILQLCSALAHVHAKGIVYQDVKASNVMIVGRERQVKLIDFDMAFDMREPSQMRAIGGTAGCMAPEQLTGGSIDPRTDIWGLGNLMFVMLAGVMAFRPTTSCRLDYENPPLLRQRNSGLIISDRAEQIVAKAMAIDSQDRFQSMAEMAAAIEACE